MPARPPMPAPQLLESPAVRRSALLAKLLEEQRRPVDIRGGYGELGARLLAQGITQWGANRAEREVADERNQRFAGQTEATTAMLARLVGGEPPAAVAPPAASPMPEPSATAPTAAVAPVGQVMGSNLPAVGQPIPPADVPPAAPISAAPAPTPMPNAPPQVMPQAGAEMAPVPQVPLAATAPVAPPAPRNPLGITPGERARIERIFRVAQETRDPALLAYAQSEMDLIEQRMNAPAAERQEYQAVNGVPGVFDPATNQWSPLPGGVPDEARTRTVVAGPRDPYGMVEGTTYRIDPNGVASTIRTPSPGYRSADGRERPIEGGPNDPSTGDNRIRNERELRREYQNATQEYRTVRTAFQKVEASLAQGTGIGDVGGIFGVMKVFDPGSTVREGEAATVQNSGGVPESIRGLYNRVVTGERLTPQQRAEIIAVGRAQFGTYEESYQNRVTDFTRMAEDYGIDPRNVVGTDESPAPPAPRPQPRNRRPAAPRRSNGQTRRYNPNTGQLE